MVLIILLQFKVQWLLYVPPGLTQKIVCSAHSAFYIVCCTLMNFHKDSSLLVCDAVLLHKQFPTFQTTLVSLSSGPGILFEAPDMKTKALQSFEMLASAC